MDVFGNLSSYTAFFCITNMPDYDRFRHLYHAVVYLLARVESGITAWHQFRGTRRYHDFVVAIFLAWCSKDVTAANDAVATLIRAMFRDPAKIRRARESYGFTAPENNQVANHPAYMAPRHIVPVTSFFTRRTIVRETFRNIAQFTRQFCAPDRSLPSSTELYMLWFRAATCLTETTQFTQGIMVSARRRQLHHETSANIFLAWCQAKKPAVESAVNFYINALMVPSMRDTARDAYDTL